MSVHLALFGLNQRKIAVIQLVLQMKDGTDSPVWKFNVHQIPTTMEQNVFVLTLEIVVCHGNIMMESNVFINQEPVLQEQIGMEPSVSPIQLVQLDSINKILNATLFLKDVYLPHSGMVAVVKLKTLVLMELISEAEVVSPMCLVKMVKFGMIIQ